MNVSPAAWGPSKASLNLRSRSNVGRCEGPPRPAAGYVSCRGHRLLPIAHLCLRHATMRCECGPTRSVDTWDKWWSAEGDTSESMLAFAGRTFAGVRCLRPLAETGELLSRRLRSLGFNQEEDTAGMAFKDRSEATAIPEDPEQLYRQLALVNVGPEELWPHQSEVLRSWHGDHRDKRDVAIELPTGAGKTLVGGLICEYQRRVGRKRAAYLCPTRQLARQAAQMLSEYSIPNVLLIGTAKRWSLADESRYRSADAVAVSVYSHVFNSKPGLDDAEVLLLDDAHAADNYVASPWSLEINRAGQPSTYADVVSVLAEALDPIVVDRLRSDVPDGQYQNMIYLASPLGVAAQAPQLGATLRSASTSKMLSQQAQHAFRLLQDHLDCCLVYVSYNALLLRPLIPPTSVHPAFARPAHRVYMSATLGSGGELERAFGRKRIPRISTPADRVKEGTGRRLFCFPQITSDLSGEPDSVDAWVAKVIAQHGRALVLAPDGRTAESFKARRLPTGFKVLDADAVEDDLDVFTREPVAALVLTRYDGIDLPGDDCRLIVLDGLPAKGDLQERFLHEALGATEVLQERIRGRITQGAGRATRNNDDFATVLILGNDLVSYVVRRDIQGTMHPEIHAELEFGYEESKDTSSADMLDNIRIFNEHGDEWAVANARIVAARDSYERVDPPGSAQLSGAASREVAACDAMWQGEWRHALSLIREVIDALRGGQAPQRYAALWSYLGSCIARRIATQTGDTSLEEAATRFYDDARAAGRGTTWLSHLAAQADAATASDPTVVDPLDECAMLGVRANADRLAKPSVFETEIRRVRAALMDTPPRPYEAALVTLGQLAGATRCEGNGNESAAPDAVWYFGDVTWVAWEAKSNAKPDGELGAEDVRQAGAHLRFAESKQSKKAPGDSSVLLVTPQARIHSTAHTVAEDHVYLVRPAEVLDLYDRLVRAWRTARVGRLTDLSPSELADIFRREGALPSQWLPKLRINPLQHLVEGVSVVPCMAEAIEGVSSGESAVADEGAGQGEEAREGAGSTGVADDSAVSGEPGQGEEAYERASRTVVTADDSAVSGEPDQGTFDHRPVPSKFVGGVDPSAGDPTSDPAFDQPPA